MMQIATVSGNNYASDRRVYRPCGFISLNFFQGGDNIFNQGVTNEIIG